jgi:hypothetical protein
MYWDSGLLTDFRAALLPSASFKQFDTTGLGSACSSEKIRKWRVETISELPVNILLTLSPKILNHIMNICYYNPQSYIVMCSYYVLSYCHHIYPSSLISSMMLHHSSFLSLPGSFFRSPPSWGMTTQIGNEDVWYKGYFDILAYQWRWAREFDYSPDSL